MKTIELKPEQIITLNDYPVYSNSVLIDYFKKCKSGAKVALVPVIHKKSVLKHFGSKVLEKFREFESDKPKAEYFMLDGSHRTTALCLLGLKVNCVVYQNDSDIALAKEKVASGEILENGTLDHSFLENCEILNKHFSEKCYFMTVVQKTEKMVGEGVLPDEIKSEVS